MTQASKNKLRATKWPQQISGEEEPHTEECLETCSGRIVTKKQQIVIWRWLCIKYLLLVSIIYAILEVVLAVLLPWDAQIHSNLGSSGQGNGLLTSGKLKCQEQSYRHLFTRLSLFCFTGPRFVFLSNCSINIFTNKEKCQITSTSFWDLDLNYKILKWGQKLHTGKTLQKKGLKKSWSRPDFGQVQLTASLVRTTQHQWK